MQIVIEHEGKRYVLDAPFKILARSSDLTQLRDQFSTILDRQPNYDVAEIYITPKA